MPPKPEQRFSTEWVQLQFPDDSSDVYGFSSTKGLITVEGVRYIPNEPISDSLLVYMHPATTQTVLPVPKAMAAAGFNVLVAGSRYTRNDTPLVMEKILRDLGSYVSYAREVWRCPKIILAGWSGGGSLALFYQAQAERPTITHTPAGDPIDVAGFHLQPADAVIFHAAHLSRASFLAELLDPSVIDELNPDARDRELDIYDPSNPNKPPYPSDYVAYFRRAQHARLQRRTAWVKEMLETFRKRGGVEAERTFVTHRTMADLRHLDPTLDPNDRTPGVSFLGEPEAANIAPSGLGRVSTLRAWLSQWSLADTNVDAEKNAASISVPLLTIRNTADNAVLGPQVERVFTASTSRSKTHEEIIGANHYYANQPQLLQQAIWLYKKWLANERLL